ncbi:hypothetical protein EBU24_02970 [bacterium]|nr:hypothetical protein [bacterium]
MTEDKSIDQLLESTAEVEIETNTTNPVIELLKQSLNIHWEQTLALTAQAEHLDRWGYKKLAAIIKTDAKQEQEHASINL